MASSNNPNSEKKKPKNAEISKTESKTNKDKEENKKKKNKKLKLCNGNSKQQDGEDEDGEEAKTHVFPMSRIRTMVKSEDSDLRVSQEAILVINNAAEKFLEQFTQDAFACSVPDRKKSLIYKHLAYAVSKERRYDFLSDFVPEKVKAEDALRERNSGGNA